MEKFNFGYSVKNIPIPSEREYKIQLTEKIEAVIRRMRWKAIFSEGNDEKISDLWVEEFEDTTSGQRTGSIR